MCRVAALKSFHGVDEGAPVAGRIGRDIGAGGEVADEPEQSREPWNAGVGIAGDDRSLSRRVWMRELLSPHDVIKCHAF